MHISQEEVDHVAKLARLEITDAEKQTFSEQLSSVLHYMEQLNEIETEGIDSTTTVLTQTHVLRDDVPRPSLLPDQAVANAPDAAEGFFAVPRILSDRS